MIRLQYLNLLKVIAAHGRVPGYLNCFFNSLLISNACQLKKCIPFPFQLRP